MISVNYKNIDLHIGDTLKVSYNIVEGGKTRVQSYEGILISIVGRDDKMITVRKIGDRGIGVERKWPLTARNLVNIEVVKHPKKVRRSKLYYLRELTGRMATRV